jgi:protein-S-isoprenylcysteine O-methyltransferase Ste14
MAGLVPQFGFNLPMKNVLAVFIAVVGALICSLGVASFRRANTTVNPITPDKASALVVDGIYRFSRNPMYLGFLFLLVAWAIFLANWPALMLAPPVFVIYMNKFQIVPEEKTLSALFGDDFESYKCLVRRWI